MTESLIMQSSQAGEECFIHSVGLIYDFGIWMDLQYSYIICLYLVSSIISKCYVSQHSVPQITIKQILL